MGRFASQKIRPRKNSAARSEPSASAALLASASLENGKK